MMDDAYSVVGADSGPLVIGSFTPPSMLSIGKAVRVDLETGDVTVMNEAALPEAAQLFWAFVRSHRVRPIARLDCEYPPTDRRTPNTVGQCIHCRTGGVYDGDGRITNPNECPVRLRAAAES